VRPSSLLLSLALPLVKSTGRRVVKRADLASGAASVVTAGREAVELDPQRREAASDFELRL
jgi:hypothetical protein